MNLNIIAKFSFKPIAFRLPIAKVLETLEKFCGAHSKHPLTVKVSNPNSFLKIKDNDSLCIDISCCLLSGFFIPENIEEESQSKIDHCKSLQEIENCKASYTGKNGQLTDILKQISTLSNQEKPIVGKQANIIKIEQQKQIETKQKY